MFQSHVTYLSLFVIATIIINCFEQSMNGKFSIKTRALDPARVLQVCRQHVEYTANVETIEKRIGESSPYVDRQKRLQFKLEVYRAAYKGTRESIRRDRHTEDKALARSPDEYEVMDWLRIKLKADSVLESHLSGLEDNVVQKVARNSVYLISYMIHMHRNSISDVDCKLVFEQLPDGEPSALFMHVLEYMKREGMHVIKTTVVEYMLWRAKRQVKYPRLAKICKNGYDRSKVKEKSSLEANARDTLTFLTIVGIIELSSSRMSTLECVTLRRAMDSVLREHAKNGFGPTENTVLPLQLNDVTMLLEKLPATNNLFSIMSLTYVILLCSSGNRMGSLLGVDETLRHDADTDEPYSYEGLTTSDIELLATKSSINDPPGTIRLIGRLTIHHQKSTGTRMFAPKQSSYEHPTDLHKFGYDWSMNGAIAILILHIIHGMIDIDHFMRLKSENIDSAIMLTKRPDVPNNLFCKETPRFRLRVTPTNESMFDEALAALNIPRMSYSSRSCRYGFAERCVTMAISEKEPSATVTKDDMSKLLMTTGNWHSLQAMNYVGNLIKNIERFQTNPGTLRNIDVQKACYAQSLRHRYNTVPLMDRETAKRAAQANLKTDAVTEKDIVLEQRICNFLRWSRHPTPVDPDMTIGQMIQPTVGMLDVYQMVADLSRLMDSYKNAMALITRRPHESVTLPNQCPIVDCSQRCHNVESHVNEMHEGVLAQQSTIIRRFCCTPREMKLKHYIEHLKLYHDDEWDLPTFKFVFGPLHDSTQDDMEDQ